MKEEIRHVLDSEIARHGWLTPQQMYEVVKKYETYVAHNKRLDGKGTSSSTSQQKATGRTSGYQPRFHKTTAFAATIEEAENDIHHSQESSPLEEVNSQGAESSQEDDEGLYIPSYLEEAIPDNPVLQVKIARAMWAQEKETRRCYKCNKQGHLQKDHDKFEEKKWKRVPPAKGASPKQVGSGEGEGPTLLAKLSHISNKPTKVKRAPYLNPDAFHRFIGPKNLGQALTDDELTTCL